MEVKMMNDKLKIENDVYSKYKKILDKYFKEDEIGIWISGFLIMNYILIQKKSILLSFLFQNYIPILYQKKRDFYLYIKTYLKQKAGANI